jgi:nucleotide-binding universal stress UspA family protein
MGAVYADSFDWNGAMEDRRIDLTRFAAAQLPKLDVECVVEAGDPAPAISRYACSLGMSLIAMPTHGYGIFRRALLGSVTAKVLHDSTLPVWTAAHAPEPSHRAHPKPRRILCALDMKPESRNTLDTALMLAKDAGASLELIHVPAETVSQDAVEHHMRDLLEEAASRQLVGPDDVPPVANELRITNGGIAEAVRNLAIAQRADLVVIGRGKIRSGLGTLFANSYDIIRESPCPVLSV